MNDYKVWLRVNGKMYKINMKGESINHIEIEIKKQIKHHHQIMNILKI
jgi:hypothetical protein